jgi:hypothetical protein
VSSAANYHFVRAPHRRTKPGTDRASSHSPASQPSQKALALLKAAASEPYPAGGAAPLDFDLDVAEEVPTADQLGTIAEYAAVPLSAFVSAHPSSAGEGGAQSAQGLAKMAERAPGAFKWPVVVDWTGGRASVGNVEGVKKMLEELRKKRDGEA